ncbi:MAG TPA: hypothetical protein PLQ76_01695 [bacterium]|nr:hypothetical protein [bacterium]
MASAFHYIDNYYIKFDYGNDGRLTAFMRGKEKKSAKELERIVGEFDNNLLSETLRLEIGKRNRKIREAILAQALSVSASMAPEEPQDSDAEKQRREMLELDEELRKIIEKTSEMSFEEDPLGISVPIAEKEDGRKTAAKPEKAKKSVSPRKNKK